MQISKERVFDAHTTRSSFVSLKINMSVDADEAIDVRSRTHHDSEVSRAPEKGVSVEMETLPRYRCLTGGESSRATVLK